MNAIFPHVYEQVDGWFDWEQTYARWAREIPRHGVLVEVGCYKGRSLSYLLVELLRLGRTDVVVHGVDDWSGVAGVAAGALLEAEFFRNVDQIPYTVQMHQAPSVHVATLFDDASVDRVWIDGSHEEADVYNDLQAWWPKVKPGGEMGGHDYSAHWGVRMAVTRWAREQELSVLVLPSCHTDSVMTDSWLVVKDAHGEG